MSNTHQEQRCTYTPDLPQARQNNDRAVMQAYGLPVKNFTKQDCVTRLMDMYKEMMK